MTAESFIQRIHQGVFPKDLFDSFQPFPDSERVESVVDAFRELLRIFPPAALESTGRLPQEMLQEMARIGLFGITIPTPYGGLGFTLREYMMIVEQMVRLDMAAALASLAHLSIGVKGIELFGNEFQKQKYLVPAASGEMIFSYALTEPRIGSDAQHIETKAELSPDGDHYLLTGQKTYVTNANYAGALTVFAQMNPARPGFMGAFIVETGREGMKIGKDIPKMGLKASSTAAVQFRDVRVPSENLLGKPGDGFRIAMTVLNYGRLALGAASLGMMRQSLEDMTKRSSTRLQFGVPIGDFPLIQEKLARAEVSNFVSAAMNDFTATLLEKNPQGNLAVETSHCKLFGTTRAWDTLYDAFQVAGGSGYLATNPYEKRLRDFRVATVFEGTTEIHSIYPAITALRNLSKEVRQEGERPFSRIRFLSANLFRKIEWPLEYKVKTLKKASTIARANAGTIRRLLLLGAAVYGEKVLEKQFFLRRVTRLSVHLYGLLALLAKLTSEEKTDLIEKQDLTLLSYYLEEVKESRKLNRRLFDSGRERLTASVVRLLHNTRSRKAEVRSQNREAGSTP